MSSIAAQAQNKIKAKAAAAQARQLFPVQMAFWQDDRRAIANELARCALFHCRDNRKPRQYFDNVELFMLGEGTVTYKGEELRTQDEDIFVTLAHLARDMPSGKMTVRVTSSDICKLNDWRQDQRYYNSIFLSIQRMKAGAITVFSRRLAKALRCQKAIEAGASEEILAQLHDELQSLEDSIGGPQLVEEKGEIAGIMLSLISGEPIMTGAEGIKNNIPQGNLTWEISLDKNLVALFAKPYLTLVDMRARNALSGTGRRLQAYFSSHKRPYPVSLRKLEKMLGLSFKDIAALKHNMKLQLEQLLENKVIVDYQFERSADGDWLVRVTRPERAQND